MAMPTPRRAPPLTRVPSTPVTCWCSGAAATLRRAHSSRSMGRSPVAAARRPDRHHAVAYAFSTNRRAIDRRTVAWGLALQVIFALIVLKTALGQAVFQRLGAAINRLLDFAFVGSSFVFGPLGDKVVWPRIMTTVLGEEGARYGVIFAFQVAADDHLHRCVVRDSLLLRRHAGRRPPLRGDDDRVMGAGAESLNVAASIFMGQTEAPLTIRPYPAADDESELMTVMTSGMAHISGGIMAAYILFGIEAKHLLTAVIMTAPGTLMMAKIFVPEPSSRTRWARSNLSPSERTSTSSTLRAEVPVKVFRWRSTLARCSFLFWRSSHSSTRCSASPV